MEANNMAAMREALSAALEQVNKVYDILSRPCVVIEEARQGCREARGVLIPALASPPRNCDIFKTESKRRAAFIAYFNEAYELKGSQHAIDTYDLDHNADGILYDYIEWLFDAADESEVAK